MTANRMRSTVVECFLREARLMPAAEFAVLMGWSPETEAAQRSRRKTPRYFKKGAAVFYRYSDVADWLGDRGSSRAEEIAIDDILK